MKLQKCICSAESHPYLPMTISVVKVNYGRRWDFDVRPNIKSRVICWSCLLLSLAISVEFRSLSPPHPPPRSLSIRAADSRLFSLLANLCLSLSLSLSLLIIGKTRLVSISLASSSFGRSIMCYSSTLSVSRVNHSLWWSGYRWDLFPVSWINWCVRSLGRGCKVLAAELL